MPSYKDKDAARDTGSSGKEAAHAWHTARDDSGARSGGDREELSSNDVERDLASPGGILDWLFGGKGKG